MKLFVLTLIISLSLNSYSQNLKSLKEFSGYVPSAVREIKSDGNFKDDNGNTIQINNLKLSDFNYITTNVTVVDDDNQIGGFGITYEKKTHKIIYSYENYIEAYDKNNNKCRLGASIEVIAQIKTNKKNLNLSDLFSLAISAGKNKIRGSISMTAKGFNSDNIYGLFNINSSIDKASVQQVLKNVGIMISKFSDKTIKLKPVVLGYESKKGSE